MKPSKTERAVSVRIDADLIARMDALADVLTLRGGKSKRSLALRAAILMGLEAFEAERVKAELGGSDHEAG